MKIAKRYAATFHDEVGELVDVEYVRRRQKTSPSDNFALRRPKVASTEWLELWKGEKKYPLHEVRCEARVQQSATRVSWAEVGQRKQ